MHNHLLKNTRAMTMRFMLICHALMAATIVTAAPNNQPKHTSDDSRIYAHTAVKGDTFGKLAARYLVKPRDYAQISKFNPNVNPNAIPIGRAIRIPVSAMRADVAPPEVIATRGSVTRNGAAVAVGQQLSEKDKLKTGNDGFVTIKLVDGSTVTLQSQSSVEIARARQLANTKVAESEMKLESGRLETKVAKQHSAGRYEVRTPTSNMGVRGTIFRAGTDTSGKKSLSEVIEGAVGVSESGKSASLGLGINAGFGTTVEAGKPPAPPVKLLAAPQLSALPDSQSATVLIAFPPVSGANGYRVQAALDSAFQQQVAEAVATQPTVTLQNLPDGNLHVRVRAIDTAGLEGLNAQQTLLVAARLTPPILLQPAADARLTTNAVNISWKPNPSELAAGAGTQTRVQIARDAAFSNIVTDLKTPIGVSAAPVQSMVSGQYFVRLAGVDARGNQGPFGVTTRFVISTATLELRPITAAGSTLVLWRGEAGQRYQYQISRSDRFNDIVQQGEVDESSLQISGLEKATYYVRVRTIKATATQTSAPSVGAWSDGLIVEVYRATTK